MNDNPLITFAVFAYDQECYIREAITGAFSQTYSPLEIILSDDCSTDHTALIMHEMAAAYKGLHKVLVNVNERNLGLVGHINSINEIANGELVIYAAGDDISYSHRTQRLVDEWIKKSKPPVCLHSLGDKIDISGRPLSERIGPFNPEYLGDPERILLYGAWIFGATAAWPPRLFEIFGPFTEDFVHEDVVVSFRSSLLGPPLFVNESLIKWRDGTGLSSRSLCHLEVQERIAYNVKIAQNCLSSALQMKKDLERMGSKDKSLMKALEIRFLIRHCMIESYQSIWRTLALGFRSIFFGAPSRSVIKAMLRSVVLTLCPRMMPKKLW